MLGNVNQYNTCFYRTKYNKPIIWSILHYITLISTYIQYRNNYNTSAMYLSVTTSIVSSCRVRLIRKNHVLGSPPLCGELSLWLARIVTGSPMQASVHRSAGRVISITFDFALLHSTGRKIYKKTLQKSKPKVNHSILQVYLHSCMFNCSHLIDKFNL